MIRTGRLAAGTRRAGFQALRCAVGLHDYAAVGLRQEQMYHYSEAHEAAYRVTRTLELLRCPHCSAEKTRLDGVDYEEIGHFEKVFVSRG